MIGSPLYLKLGSLCSGRKWILFSVDQVNVKLFWESSLQITDGVAQLLSNGISKRHGQKLGLSKLAWKSRTLCLYSSAENSDQIRPNLTDQNSLSKIPW